MFGKKKTLGFKKPPRSLDEINKDYNFHAAQAGHKARVVGKIQEEIDHHFNRMASIDAEAKLLPPVPPTPTPSPSTETIPPQSSPEVA